MRNPPIMAALVVLAGCRLGESIATAPPDADQLDPATDGGDDDGDAGPCEPGRDGDGDGVADCDELGDGDPVTDPAVFNGLIATIGERPEVTGSCDALDDRAEMSDRFDPSVAEMPVIAGWEFDTAADSYDDPSYGFDPPWPAAQSGRFSVRFHGELALAAGTHCFAVDIGATGTDIINGRNGCGQVWVDAGASPDAPLAETGFGAASTDAATGCVAIDADGSYAVDLVFWYFNIFEQARFAVRHCAGAGCTPDAPITAAQVQARP